MHTRYGGDTDTYPQQLLSCIWVVIHGLTPATSTEPLTQPSPSPYLNLRPPLTPVSDLTGQRHLHVWSPVADTLTLAPPIATILGTKSVGQDSGVWNLPSEDRLRELGFFSLVNTSLLDDLIAAFQCLKGWQRGVLYQCNIVIGKRIMVLK